MAAAEQPRRRRRVRGPESTPAPTADPGISVQTTPVFDEPQPAALGPAASAPAASAPVAAIPAAAIPAAAMPVAAIPVAAADSDPSASERGLRGLVGPGSSQVTPAAALRARDAARARPEDIARAEADLTIIRRNWSPRE